MRCKILFTMAYLRGVILLLCLPLMVCAFNPFKSASQEVSARNDRAEALPELNPKELLEATLRKPEIYTKAILELKRLEEEPICHRVAAQLLMNNCRGLENMGDSEYQFHSAHLQRHHVESFAASLALCDLERGGFIIPPACVQFTSSYLMRASHGAKGRLEVSPDQVGSCLGALGQDHSHWMTWLSYRDKALLFCRAARFDIDKDQAILSHKKLTQIMAEFADGLDEDLRSIKQKMSDQAHATDSYFEGMKSQAEHLKNKIQVSIDSISTDFKEAASSIKTTIGSTKDLQRILRNLIESLMQSNAEIAASRERALSVTTNRAKSEMEDLSLLAGETGAAIAELKDSIWSLLPAITSLGMRQDALDKRSDLLFATMVNMTILLKNHTKSLEQANTAAYGIHHSLEKAALAAQSWNETVGISGMLGEYALRIACPMVSVLLGNHGLPPSLARNAALILGGFGIAESVVKIRHSTFSWYSWDWLWAPVASSPNMRHIPTPLPSASGMPNIDLKRNHFEDFVEIP
ncbi:hypothetical protein B0O99DRAFT_736507 [Bisporella sp. PMI_857]|nr:hypothetical protein B0O99DRAFT_736507 [Bisporella sp. PMI_857]